MNRSGLTMDRTLYRTGIEAVKIIESTVRITCNNHSGNDIVTHNVLPKEWAFIEDILETFSSNDPIVDTIIKIAPYTRSMAARNMCLIVVLKLNGKSAEVTNDLPVLQWNRSILRMSAPGYAVRNQNRDHLRWNSHDFGHSGSC